MHGVAGAASDLAYLGLLLGANPELVVLAPRCNEPLRIPFEGIVAGGERILALILTEISRSPALCKISLIGHSLGGLYARYVAGVLFGRCGCALEPANLITLATPHLGVRRPVSRPLLYGGAINRLYAHVAQTFCSRTGVELSLGDEQSEPLLVQLCKGPYLHALRRFKRLRLYSNIYNDFLVPYCTASIQPFNPYRRGEWPLLTASTYPHITLYSLYRLALADGSAPPPAVEPAMFPNAPRALPGVDSSSRALAPLSAGACRLERAIDEARVCAARTASKAPRAPRLARSASVPAQPSAVGAPSSCALSASARTDSHLGAASDMGACAALAMVVEADDDARVGTYRPPSRELSDGERAEGGARGGAPSLGSPQQRRLPPALRVDSASADTSAWDDSFGSEREKREHLLHMLYCLNSVPWERVDCHFVSPAAHEQIVNKSAWTAAVGFDMGDVCRHVLECFTD
jgi:hypothetical protein